MSTLAISEKVDSETGVVLSFGFIINKLNRDPLRKLKNNIRKLLKKQYNCKEIEINEVNTFFFVSAIFDIGQVSITETRIELENQIKSIIIDYSLMESNRFSDQIFSNIEIKDIKQILLSLINTSTYSNVDDLAHEVNRRTEEIKNRAMARVADVILNSFVISWEFPKGKEDIIVFPNYITKRLVSQKSIFPLSTMIENLSIVQFASVYLKNLSWIAGSFEYALDNLHSLLDNEEIYDFIRSNTNNELWRSLRVMFGLLSTTQQIISDLLKQINRINEIKDDLNHQIKVIQFPELAEFIKTLNLDAECADFVVWLSQLQQDTKLVYKRILDLINCCQDIEDQEVGDISDIIHSFSWSLADIQVMKFFTDTFRDITFFQSIPPEVAVEDKKTLRIPDSVVIKGVALFKTYRLYGSTVYALRGVDIEIHKGEMVAILGPSGSGKTTLLNLLAGLDTPEHGAVFFKGENLHMMSDSILSTHRRNEMGFIFQYYNLIPQLTVLENVMLPGIMANRSPRKVRKKALALLKEVGIDRFKNQFPIKLSGGQMQRVTIARSMINNPALLFADEPTGDLDSETGKVVVDLIHRFAKEKNTAVIFVTHDSEMAQRCDKIVRIRDGQVDSVETPQ